MTDSPTTALRERVAQQAQNPDTPPEPTLRDRIKAMQAQFAMALPTNLTVDRFVRTVLTELSKNARLGDCTESTFLGAITTAAQLGLEFGPLGLAYLVPFWNGSKGCLECQLIVGYKGVLQLARRSGEIKDLKVVAVHENDREFDLWEDENGTHLIHRPAFENRGAVVRYYGRATFTNGGSLVMIISLDEIERRKARSQSANQGFSPWKSDEEAMRLKTGVHVMKPWLPLATEAVVALDSDQQTFHYRARGQSYEVTAERMDDAVPPAPPIEATAVPAPAPAPAADPPPAPAPPVPDTPSEPPRSPQTAPDDAPGYEGPPPEDSSAPVDYGEPGPSERYVGDEADEDGLPARIKAILDALSSDRLNEVSRYLGVTPQGRKEARVARLIPAAVAAFREGDAAIVDLF